MKRTKGRVAEASSGDMTVGVKKKLRKGEIKMIYPSDLGTFKGIKLATLKRPNGELVAYCIQIGENDMFPDQGKIYEIRDAHNNLIEPTEEVLRSLIDKGVVAGMNIYEAVEDVYYE